MQVGRVVMSMWAAALVVLTQLAVVGTSSSAGVAAAANTPSAELFIGGEPVTVGEDGAAQPVMATFAANEGERVALSARAADGYSWIGVRSLNLSE